MRTGSAHAVDGIERAFGRVAAASAQIYNHLPSFDAAQLFYGFTHGMLGGEAADNHRVGVVAVQPLHQAVAHMLASVVKTGAVQNAVGFDAVVVIGGVGQAAEQAVALAMLHVLAEMAVGFLQKVRGIVALEKAAAKIVQMIVGLAFHQYAFVGKSALVVEFGHNFMRMVHTLLVVGGKAAEFTLGMDVQGNYTQKILLNRSGLMGALHEPTQ